MKHEAKLNNAAEEYEEWAESYDTRDYPTYLSVRDAFIAGAKWMESKFELIHGKEKGEDYGFTFDKNASIDVYIRKKDE